jgi:hypothetical protein
MNFKFFRILFIYTIWDGLSLKTISRYCPFKHLGSYWQEEQIRKYSFGQSVDEEHQADRS